MPLRSSRRFARALEHAAPSDRGPTEAVLAAVLRCHDAHGDAVVLSDVSVPRILWASPGAVELYGRSLDELYAMDPMDLLDEADRRRLEERRRLRAAGHGLPTRFATAVRRPDGSAVHVECSSVALDDKHVLTTARDVSMYRHAQERLAQDSQFLQKILDLADSLIVVLDAEGRVLLFNRAAERLTGQRAVAVVGRTPAEAGLLPEGATKPFGIWRDTEDRLHDLVWTSAPIRRDGRVAYVVGTALELTDAGRRDSLSGFASLISHDLREPMRVIRGFAQLLEEAAGDRLTERERGFLKAMTSAVERMDALLTDLSDWARAGEGTPVPTDSGAVADRVLSELAVSLTRTGATIDQDDLPTVYADPEGLRKLLHELLSNALLFGASEEPRVRLSADREPTGWHFVIADNGPGVAPAHRSRVLELFQRAVPREAAPGTGAGLAICRRIVEAHGGRLWLDDAPEGGCAAHFTLREGA